MQAFIFFNTFQNYTIHRDYKKIRLIQFQICIPFHNVWLWLYNFQFWWEEQSWVLSNWKAGRRPILLNTQGEHEAIALHFWTSFPDPFVGFHANELYKVPPWISAIPVSVLDHKSLHFLPHHLSALSVNLTSLIPASLHLKHDLCVWCSRTVYQKFSHHFLECGGSTHVLCKSKARGKKRYWARCFWFYHEMVWGEEKPGKI